MQPQLSQIGHLHSPRIDTLSPPFRRVNKESYGPEYVTYHFTRISIILGSRQVLYRHCSCCEEGGMSCAGGGSCPANTGQIMAHKTVHQYDAWDFYSSCDFRPTFGLLYFLLLFVATKVFVRLCSILSRYYSPNDTHGLDG